VNSFFGDTPHRVAFKIKAPTTAQDFSNRSTRTTAWLRGHSRSCWEFRLESSAHRCQSSEPSCRKRQRDRPRAKTLHGKLHDLPRSLRKRGWPGRSRLGEKASRPRRAH